VRPVQRGWINENDDTTIGDRKINYDSQVGHYSIVRAIIVVIYLKAVTYSHDSMQTIII